MARKNRTPEENARREKIRELLQMANIGSMDDIQNLFKETIAEFMENGLEAELDDELGYSKYDYKNKNTDNSRNGHSRTIRTRIQTTAATATAAKLCAPALEMWMCRSLEIGRGNLSPRC